MKSANFSGFVVLLVTLAATSSQSLATHDNPQSASLRNGQVQRGTSENSGQACGTLDDVAKNVEVCAKPLMDLLQGTIEKWPRTNDDAQELCNSFGQSERCIRDTSRRCVKGLHKTIISTLANSIQRARKRECNVRSKMPLIVRTTTCLEKSQDTVHNWMLNATGRLHVIETQIFDLNQRIKSLCCVLHDMENEIRAILNPICPEEAALIVRLYRTVLEDVLELICHAPKCHDYLKDYKVTKSADFSGIISVLLRIVLSLDA